MILPHRTIGFLCIATLLILSAMILVLALPTTRIPVWFIYASVVSFLIALPPRWYLFVFHLLATLCMYYFTQVATLSPQLGLWQMPMLVTTIIYFCIASYTSYRFRSRPLPKCTKIMYFICTTLYSAIALLIVLGTMT